MDRIIKYFGLAAILLAALPVAFVAATNLEGDGQYVLKAGDRVKAGDYAIEFFGGTGHGYGQETRLQGEFTLYFKGDEYADYSLNEGESFSFGNGGNLTLLDIRVESGEAVATVDVSFPAGTAIQQATAITNPAEVKKITAAARALAVPCIKSANGACVKNAAGYKAVMNCSNATCLKERLNISNVGVLVRSCNAQEDKESCLLDLKERWLNWLRYSLQKHLDVVDDVEARGVPAELCNEIREILTQGYEEFLNASTTAERRETLNELNSAWKEFRREAAKHLLAEKANGLAVRAENAVQTLERVRDRLQEKGFDVTALNQAINYTKENAAAIGAENTLSNKWMNAKRVSNAVAQAKAISQRIINNGSPAFAVQAVSVPSMVTEAETG